MLNITLLTNLIFPFLTCSVAAIILYVYRNEPQLNYYTAPPRAGVIKSDKGNTLYTYTITLFNKGAIPLHNVQLLHNQELFNHEQHNNLSSVIYSISPALPHKISADKKIIIFAILERNKYVTIHYIYPSTESEYKFPKINQICSNNSLSIHSDEAIGKPISLNHVVFTPAWRSWLLYLLITIGVFIIINFLINSLPLAKFFTLLK